MVVLHHLVSGRVSDKGLSVSVSTMTVAITVSVSAAVSVRVAMSIAVIVSLMPHMLDLQRLVVVIGEDRGNDGAKGDQSKENGGGGFHFSIILKWYKCKWKLI